MKTLAIWLGAACLLACTLGNFAVAETSPISDVQIPIGDAQIEERLKNLSQELRCLVCQNTTLADSNAPLAEDLRNEVRAQIRTGKSDEQVVAYLVQRYGDFVRYRPPVNSNTALLWFGPALLLLGALWLLWRALKKHAAQSGGAVSELGEDE